MICISTCMSALGWGPLLLPGTVMLACVISLTENTTTVQSNRPRWQKVREANCFTGVWAVVICLYLKYPTI